jgi:hypothetical protein
MQAYCERGHHLCRQQLISGSEVRVLVRLQQNKPEQLRGTFQIVGVKN